MPRLTKSEIAWLAQAVADADLDAAWSARQRPRRLILIALCTGLCAVAVALAIIGG